MKRKDDVMAPLMCCASLCTDSRELGVLFFFAWSVLPVGLVAARIRPASNHCYSRFRSRILLRAALARASTCAHALASVASRADGTLYLKAGST